MAAPTVASLSAALGNHLVAVAGFDAPRREISAVHISELLEPDAYLTGGELLLTTGLALPEDVDGCTSYVARLRAADISALALGLGPVHQEPPAGLVAACRDLGVPLMVVPPATPFLTISRAYWTAQSRSTEERLNDIVAAHRALVEAATAANPAASLLAQLARWLDGWAVLLDASGAVDLTHPLTLGAGLQVLEAEVKRLDMAGVHSSASFQVADHIAVMFPLAVGSQVVGYLAAGSPRQLEAAQRRVVLTAAALLSLEAVRRQHAESARGATRRCVALLTDLGLIDAARRLAAETSCPTPTRQVAVLVVRGRDSEVLSQTVERWCGEALTVGADRSTVWCLLPDRHPTSEDLRRRLDVSDPTASFALSDLVAVENAGVVRARLLQEMRMAGTGESMVPRRGDDHAVAQSVDAFLAAARADLRAALVAYLRHRGQWEAASASLDLHRNTLRYRVSRASELLGLDLDDPDVAAQAWLALRARGATS